MASWHDHTKAGSTPRWILALLLIGACFCAGALGSYVGFNDSSLSMADRWDELEARVTTVEERANRVDAFKVSMQRRQHEQDYMTWASVRCANAVEIDHTYTSALFAQCIVDYLNQ